MTTRKIFLFTLLTLVLFSPCAQSFPEASDGIVAIVNDEVITLKDLREYLSMVHMSLTASKLTPGEIKEAMAYYQENGLQKLIDERLKIHQADKLELVIRPEAVDKRIREIKKQYPSEKVFSDELIAQGMTMTDLKKKVLDQFKAYYAEELEVRSKIIVSPQEVTAYYQNNPAEFLDPERANVVSIFIPFNNDKKAAEQQAREALAIINDPQELAKYPKGLEDVAAKFSGVSSPDTLKKGEVLPEVAQAVFALEPNETTGPISTENGIYLFKLIEKFPESTLSLDEAKDRIYDMIFQKKLNERREAWLKKLREESYIEIK